MTKRSALQVPYHWEFKPLAMVDVAGVQNTWYTVLDTTRNVRLYSVGAKQTNDEAAAKATNTRWTIDGVVTTLTGSTVANNTMRYWFLDPNNDSVIQSAAIIMTGNYVALHGRSVKVEVMNASVAGTNQHLYGYVRYAVLEVAPT